MNGRWSVQTNGPDETRKLGQALGLIAQTGDIVLLSGSLGAGKTQFAKGVAEGLCVLHGVTSPTFPIIAEYDGRVPFVHMDLYRLYDHPERDTAILHPDRLREIAFDDYFDGSAVVLIEWPQGVRDELGPSLDVELTSMADGRDDVRLVNVAANGTVAESRLREWVRQCE